MYEKFKRHSDVLPSGFSVKTNKDTLSYALNTEKLEYNSLGNQIRLANDNKDVLGVAISPEFDSDDCNDIDVNVVSKMDAFDLYEQFGSKPDPSPIPPASQSE